MISKRFHGGPVIVTGAARGIGLAVARRAARDGAHVALLDIDGGAVENSALELTREGGVAIAVQADVSDAEQVHRAIAEIVQTLGPPRVLVNNAGIYKSAGLGDVTPADWNHMLGVNLSGVFFCVQATVPRMIELGGATIVNISSIGAKIGWIRNHAYCASKAGLIGLTRVLALELAPYQITVNAVCPGNTTTNMMKAVDADVAALENLAPGEFTRAQAKRIPLGRLAEPNDIAGAVAFLASADASHITGQAINVDGGSVMF